ncbi:MAG: helix-turn-helix transcriptional regulator [Hyphomicrobium sp.]
MPDALSRLQRLERLRGLLASRDMAIVKDVALELGVSVRTVMRDLDLLRDDGVLIEGDRGRGGGIRVARGHASGRISLSTSEAIDLLISMAIAEKMRSPLMLGRLRAVRQKIAVTFARAHQDGIKTLRRRILIGEAASLRTVAEYRPGDCKDVEAVRLAFFERRLLNITYRDMQARVTEREVEPHYLFLSAPVWYVLAWDNLRQDVRTFRIDRILKAVASPRKFPARSAGPFMRLTEFTAEAL